LDITFIKGVGNIDTFVIILHSLALLNLKKDYFIANVSKTNQSSLLPPKYILKS